MFFCVYLNFPAFGKFIHPPPPPPKPKPRWASRYCTYIVVLKSNRWSCSHFRPSKCRQHFQHGNISQRLYLHNANLHASHKVLHLLQQLQIVHQYRSQLKILDARTVIRSKFHAEVPLILSSIVQNLVATATWRPEFGHPCSTCKMYAIWGYHCGTGSHCDLLDFTILSIKVVSHEPAASTFNVQVFCLKVCVLSVGCMLFRIFGNNPPDVMTYMYAPADFFFYNIFWQLCAI
jgi:hypothetical protein